ncbi:MAG: hypothetical protein IJ480_00055 [Clostridia bacterium]|nr:hypothetical protein [Clostridia bacterium]
MKITKGVSQITFFIVNATRPFVSVCGGRGGRKEYKNEKYTKMPQIPKKDLTFRRNAVIIKIS